MKRRSTMTTLVLGTALLVVAAAPASAKNGVDPALNKPGFWETDGVTCSKTELRDGVETFALPAAPEGSVWSLLVMKAGAGARANAVVDDPEVGVAYAHPTGKDLSHVITCLRADEDPGDGDPGDGDPGDGDPGDGGVIYY